MDNQRHELSERRLEMGTKKRTKTVDQKYKDAYSAEWPVIRKSQKGDTYAFCTSCTMDFSVSHGGRNDCLKHVSTDRHRRNSASITSNSKILDFVTRESQFEVINAEVLFSNFIVEHNLPIGICDHVGPLFKKMFTDSKIAQQYGCARTKTSAILNTLGDHDSSIITENMKTGPYSLATDGSTDMSNAKLYPVVVRYFNNTSGKVDCVLLSLVESTAKATGENIFKILDAELNDRGIPWENCVSFAADNASVMMGKNKGVVAYITQRQSHIYPVGCACHLMALAAKKATKQLPCSVDDVLVDIYFYLDKSSLRQQTLKETHLLHGQEMKKILKHVQTRWLSLGHCLVRLIDQWNPLQQFFGDELQYLTSKKGGKKAKNQKSQTTSGQPSTQMKQGSSSEGTTGRSKDINKASNFEQYVVADKYNQSGFKAQNTKKSNLESNTIACANGSSLGDKNNVKATKVTKVKGTVKGTGMSDKRIKRKLIDISDNATKSKVKKMSCPGNKTARSKVPGRTSSGSNKSQIPNAEPPSSTASHTKRKKETEGSSGKPLLTSNAATASKKTPYAVRKVTSVNEFLTCKQNKLYCLFLRSALPLFEKANCVLQHEEPHIHKLRRVLERQLKEIMVRFVKPCILKGDCTQVDFLCKNNQKSNEDLFIGNDARKFIISENKTNTENFYENVREFYSVACSYMVKTFPYHDEVLFHAEVADPSVRQEKSFESLNYFVTRFPAIMSGKSSESLDVLESQFLLYQVCESLPKIERVDHFWSSVATMKDENGVLQFSVLSEVMKGILVIFHSNVDCERFFSLVTKNKTKFRPNLGTKLLSSILTHKVFMNAAGKVCHTMKHDKAILKKAKKSTYIANTSRNAS
ncbi:Zinc finger BED domain-containing protein 5 [Holothuria leucospilota]|uniref:Zinc finger BED domain-containing protein 5 n=1 Tax=Holothuria leucospilota TaxID=206669 RepID=A0A9Q1CSH2_HOLLE|nr:Zinc finger BED domain-containing protein 5 [Holothuria leucospilota]